MALAGIVLCGGQSTRMGTPKAWLPFGPEPMLVRVVRLLSAVAAPIVVVGAADDELPPLPSEIRIARDEHAARGPLEGLRTGLATLLAAGHEPSSAAYVTSCDVPFLVPSFVRKLESLLDDFDAVAPVDSSSNRHEARALAYPLAAVYRLKVVSTVEQLLRSNQLRMSSLLDGIQTRRVPIEDFRDVDPQLDTLVNLNRPEEYARALVGVRSVGRNTDAASATESCTTSDREPPRSADAASAEKQAEWQSDDAASQPFADQTATIRGVNGDEPGSSSHAPST